LKLLSGEHGLGEKDIRGSSETAAVGSSVTLACVESKVLCAITACCTHFTAVTPLPIKESCDIKNIHSIIANLSKWHYKSVNKSVI
jgi:hypothetical protein